MRHFCNVITRQKTSHTWGEREGDRERDKAARSPYYKDHPLSIAGLIHSWGQNLHSLITSWIFYLMILLKWQLDVNKNLRGDECSNHNIFQLSCKFKIKFNLIIEGKTWVIINHLPEERCYCWSNHLLNGKHLMVPRGSRESHDTDWWQSWRQICHVTYQDNLGNKADLLRTLQEDDFLKWVVHFININGAPVTYILRILLVLEAG